MLRIALAAALSLATLAPGAPASAQASYPTRPISITVPFAAGGPTDTVARSLAEAMQRQMPGSSIIVENVGGAGGTIGVAKVAKAQPDGYSLLLMHIGISTAPALYRKLQFDPLRDFEYVGLINEVPMTLLVKNDLPVNDLRGLVAYLKANANKVSFANAGIGSASHLCGLLFMSAIQTDLTTVPYKGTAPAMTDLIGGQVDMLCDQTTNTTQQIRANRVKAIAITSPKRLPTLPNVATTAEGGLPALNVEVWHGLYAPKGTPKPVVDRLVAALQGALKDPAVVKRFEDLGAEVVSADRATPAALERHLKAEIEKWTPVIRKAGVYAD